MCTGGNGPVSIGEVSCFHYDKPRLLHDVICTFLARTIPSSLTSIMIYTYYVILTLPSDAWMFSGPPEVLHHGWKGHEGCNFRVRVQNWISHQVRSTHLHLRVFYDSRHLIFNNSKNHSNMFRNIRCPRLVWNFSASPVPEVQQGHGDRAQSQDRCWRFFLQCMLMQSRPIDSSQLGVYAGMPRSTTPRPALPADPRLRRGLGREMCQRQSQWSRLLAKHPRLPGGSRGSPRNLRSLSWWDFNI